MTFFVFFINRAVNYVNEPHTVFTDDLHVFFFSTHSRVCAEHSVRQNGVAQSQFSISEWFLVRLISCRYECGGKDCLSLYVGSVIDWRAGLRLSPSGR